MPCWIELATCGLDQRAEITGGGNSVGLAMLRAKFAQHTQVVRSSTRLISTSAVLRNVTSSSAGTTTPKKPIGSVRGGYVPDIYHLEDTNTYTCPTSIIGFLLGFSIASSFAAYHLLEEYRQASAALQTSVDELKLSTEKVGFLVC